MNALITELVLPLALVLLHAVLAPASAVGLVLRFVGIALLLLYLAFAGVWLFPPWWTPWALLVRARPTHPSVPPLPKRRWRGWRRPRR